jgi:hypothetical protein
VSNLVRVREHEQDSRDPLAHEGSIPRSRAGVDDGCGGRRGLDRRPAGGGPDPLPARRNVHWVGVGLLPIGAGWGGCLNAVTGERASSGRLAHLHL